MADAPSDANRTDIWTQLERWLEANLHALPIETETLSGRWAKRFLRGWTFSAEIAETQFVLEFLIDDCFPRSFPRIALVNPPPFPSYPHVEADGLVCVLSTMDEPDLDNPIGISKYVIGNAVEVLEQGLNGENHEEFRTEFLSYWNPTASGIRFLSILDPCDPSRKVAVWRGKKFNLVGENASEIRRWLSNAYGKLHVANSRIEPAMLLWLPQPMLPSEYPSTLSDVQALAEAAGAQEVFNSVIALSKSQAIVILGSNTEDGACFAGASAGLMNQIGGRYRRKGFAILQNGKIARSVVHRADAYWIHGRDSNSDLETLQGAKVCILGCGSLGSAIVRLLAQAGISEFRLIDPDTMGWGNVGRHILGASAVRVNKATALRYQLSRDFPHLKFTDYPTRWQQAQDALIGCDLAISTIGSWSEEAELAELQLSNKIPVIYGWSEPNGCAGHAVATGLGSGCLGCGVSAFGEPINRVVEWSSNSLKREAACGTFFQPYGASEITLTATVAADLATDVLLERVQFGVRRIVAARQNLVESLGGKWSDWWIQVSNGRATGGNLEQVSWSPSLKCKICWGRGIE